MLDFFKQLQFSYDRMNAPGINHLLTWRDFLEQVRLVSVLKLIVNNELKRKNCQNSCLLFNQEYNCCSIFSDLEYENPNILKQCQNYVPLDEEVWGEEEEMFQTLSYMESISTSTYSGLNFTVNGETLPYTDYPEHKPSISYEENLGLEWFVSPDHSFGCWIMNDSLRPMVLKDSYDSVEKGWSEQVYRSPIPLHNHKCSESLRSRVCWYVDPDGWGQYSILVNNRIGFLTSPRP